VFTGRAYSSCGWHVFLCEGDGFESNQTNRFYECVFRLQAHGYFLSEGFDAIRPKSALTPEEKAELSELNLLDAFAEERHRLYSRHYDRIPVLPKHEITLQRNQSELCDDVEFIDVTPTSLRVRFPLALWMDGTLSIKQHENYHSISRGRVISVNKNQLDAVFVVSPELTLN